MSALAEAAPRTPTITRATLEIDLEAVAENTRLMVQRSGTAVMAVVKADGFGHGALAVATTALSHGATSLGVTSIDEALTLRAAGIVAPILSWLNAPTADFAAAIAAGIDLGVPSLEHLGAVLVAATAARRPAHVHLHADTGLARDGVAPDQWEQLCARAATAERAGSIRVTGLMGHLPCADRPGDRANADARAAFDRFVSFARAAGLSHARRHLAATSATLTDPRSRYDLCRVGAGLVGIDPSGTTSLRSAMTLLAPLVSIRSVAAGTGVGYGHTYVTPRATRLGLLPVGYADGIPRSASAHGEVLVSGRRCRIVGLISMDQLVVDLRDVPALPGDVATVLGPGDHGEPTPIEWAAWSGALPHDLVTGFGPRITRSVRPATAPRLRALPPSNALPSSNVRSLP